MEIFGVGASELIFILIIAIIILGPKDMQKAGRTIGRWLNQLVRSDSWKVFQRTSTELRNLPRNLMREANMEVAEVEKGLRNAIDPRIDAASDTAASQNPSHEDASQPVERTLRASPPQSTKIDSAAASSATKSTDPTTNTEQDD
jgi:sec-independent protein translocase protein TatB